MEERSNIVEDQVVDMGIEGIDEPNEQESLEAKRLPKEIRLEVELDIHHFADKGTIASLDEIEGGDRKLDVEWGYNDIQEGNLDAVDLEDIRGNTEEQRMLVYLYHRKRDQWKDHQQDWGCMTLA